MWRCPRRYSVCHASSLSPSVKPIGILEEAAQLERPVEVSETTVPITLKLPLSTVSLLRKYASSSGLAIGVIVTRALNAFLSALKRHG